jgi:SAM-dependent methyltransferase
MSASQPSTDPQDSISFGPANRTWTLFLVSAFGLFLELLLIRWVGTEIRIFAYLQNTILVVCFLGLGMGCLTCRQQASLRDVLTPLLILAVLLAIPLTRTSLGKISEFLSVLGDLVIWRPGVSTSIWTTGFYVCSGLGLTFCLMMLIWDIFIPIGRWMGRLLSDHPRPVQAYSVNVAGSLIGIWVFVGLSIFSLPPLAWVVVLAGLALFFVSKNIRQRRLDVGALGAILALSWCAGLERNATEVCWTPYQKLALQQLDPDRDVQGEVGASRVPGLKELTPGLEGIGDFIIWVNNVGYQVMINLEEGHVRNHPEHYPAQMRGYSQYDLPARLHPHPKKLLAVGAGSGNDVAGALRQGVPDVVGVEIDPTILAMGKRHHPERPYDSPSVRLVNDDARSFFATSTERFDVISFGLLDSHTTTAMTNARLDHYVYTRESLQQAKSLLAEGGVLVLSFEVQKPYIADRMARALRDVFGKEPLCFRVPLTGYGSGGVFFVTGDLEAVRKQLAKQPALEALIARWQLENPVALPGTAPVVTDDWPYVYLESRQIPVLYLFLVLLMFLLLVRGLRRLRTPGMLRGWKAAHWHFFFMGAAFLLLEVQNISKASVVLGNTWQVNAVIISCILSLILVANWIASVVPRLPLWPVYTLLCGSCVGLYFLDISQFGALPYAARAALVGGLISLPMLFSGIVFIRSFAGVARKDVALGANLLGSLVGGLLQSITFVIGIKALLLIVAVLYLAAWWTRPVTAPVVEVNEDAVEPTIKHEPAILSPTA